MLEGFFSVHVFEFVLHFVLVAELSPFDLSPGLFIQLGYLVHVARTEGGTLLLQQVVNVSGEPWFSVVGEHLLFS
jgi:hypothetical protein